VGGQNSGRIEGFAKHETVEELGACKLQVGLATRSCGQNGSCTYVWSAAGCEIASARLSRVGSLMNVSYAHAQAAANGVTTTVRLTETACNFGGTRVWFLCPACGRRTGSIFLVEPMPRCRVCLRLTYQSQREGALDGILNRAALIRNRLQGRGSAFSYGTKPKGMHRRTYQRLVGELEHLRRTFYGCLAGHYRFPVTRIEKRGILDSGSQGLTAAAQLTHESVIAICRKQ
jgi:hypothetical protein